MRKISLYVIVLFILVSGSLGTVSAQYLIPDKSLCEQLRTRTVIVELKDDTTGSDEVLRNAFKDYWTLTPVEFVSSSDFKHIITSGDTKYAALLAYSGEHVHTMERWDAKGGGSFVTSKSFYFDHFDLAISLITGPNTPKPVCTISFANKDIMTSDLLFAVQQISRLVNTSLKDIKGLDYYDHKKNIEFVKTKTLLIPQELFKEKDLAKLKDKYEFPHKVVSLREMNDLVLSKNEQYIYPKIIWSMQHNAYGWITISAKDGSITSFMAFGGIHTASEQSADEVIKVGDLQYIASNMAQGMNNKYK